MGEWVLAETCRALRRLANAECPLRLAINVSPRQFRQAGFVSRLKAIFAATGADPTRLTLEITEGLAIDDLPGTIAKMVELKNLGLHFSIDDFGTGYSSLSYLKRLPVNELKIDRSFVQDAPTDANDAALVETILAVAHHLKLAVVAEGVETVEQETFLKARGCIFYQGYLYGRPEPAETFLKSILSTL
jgi:EAL domain-containing protein (putative c-di-GMP-specific phosphodiesterase class I)